MLNLSHATSSARSHWVSDVSKRNLCPWSLAEYRVTMWNGMFIFFTPSCIRMRKEKDPVSSGRVIRWSERETKGNGRREGEEDDDGVMGAVCGVFSSRCTTGMQSLSHSLTHEWRCCSTNTDTHTTAYTIFTLLHIHTHPLSFRRIFFPHSNVTHTRSALFAAEVKNAAATAAYFWCPVNKECLLCWMRCRRRQKKVNCFRRRWWWTRSHFLMIMKNNVHSDLTEQKFSGKR